MAIPVIRLRQSNHRSERPLVSVHRAAPAGLPDFPDGSLPELDGRRRLVSIRATALLAIAATLAYLSWRTLFTVNLDVWWVSVPLLLLEVHAFIGLALFTFSLWDTQAVAPARQVNSTTQRVAVLIPTYNEGLDVLLPTIAAAVALEPEHETWVLDDGRRAEVEALATSVGARYLTRVDNRHAKAGNINHALSVIDADFVAVLDADHVATPQFLTNTLGYFDDPRIALVQTPQDFYNAHSFEHDLDAESEYVPDDQQHRYHEQALFYRVIQPGKNRWGGAFWCGTNAVVRVSALQEIGGIATETVTEDIHTTIRLHRRGWKTVYHNEVLARGLAAASADQYQLQRYRWGTGAMQVLRQENPLWVSGLSLGQRLTYAKTILGWFDAWRTLGYLVIPPLVLLTGAVPIAANPWVYLTIFISVFLIQRAALRLLSREYFNSSLQLVFELVRMTPNIMASLTLLRPGQATFRVTPKGRVGDVRRRVPAPAVLPALLGVSAVSALWFVLTMLGLTPLQYDQPWVAYGALFWLMVNGWFIGAAIRRVHSTDFGTERRAGVRFDTVLDARLNSLQCRTLDVSLSGARITGPRGFDRDELVTLSIDPDILDLRFNARVRSQRQTDDGSVMYGLEFTPGQYRERARLALALFNGQAQPDERPATAFDVVFAAD